MSQKEDGEDPAATPDLSEARTDRYGFLLENGDASRLSSSDEPDPEKVRDREMKWLSMIHHWDLMMEKNNSKVKTRCQKGIPGSVRSKCWPLLCGAAQRKEKNKELYQRLEAAPGRRSWIEVIRRDTDRQFPFHEMFQSKDGHGQQGLLNVLKVYTQFRPDEGYCQAQGPVAAVLLMMMPMEEAFWCLVQISELYLPGYYSPLLEGVLFDAAVLSDVLRRSCLSAYKHMQRQGVEPLMFATDWLMCLYSRHLPFNTLLRVWDLFFCYGVRVLFQVAVVLVRRCLGDAKLRRECEGQIETLERLRGVRERVQQEQADVFIHEVCSVPLSSAELQRLTDKEFEKWIKDRPGSTFDPRGRCHGFHMVWEKEKGQDEAKEKPSRNLVTPVVRSHSSLSPAILRNKWRKKRNKMEEEEWEEGKRRSSQGGQDDGDKREKRRASVCITAEELKAKTEFSLQKDKTMPETPRCKASAHSTSPDLSYHSMPVFEEDKDVLLEVPSQNATNSKVGSEEGKSSSSLAEEVTSQTEEELETSPGPQTLQEEQNQNVQDEEMPEEVNKSNSSREDFQQNVSELNQETESKNLQEQVVMKSCGPKTAEDQNISTEDKEQVEMMSCRQAEDKIQIIQIRIKEKEMKNDQENKAEEKAGTESHEHKDEIQINQISQETDVPRTQEPEEEDEHGMKSCECEEVQINRIRNEEYERQIDQETKIDVQRTQELEEGEETGKDILKHEEEIQNNQMRKEDGERQIDQETKIDVQRTQELEGEETGKDILKHEEEIQNNQMRKEDDERQIDQETETDVQRTQELKEGDKPEIESCSNDDDPQINLINNEREEMPDDHETTKEEENGPGMESEHEEEIWCEFSRQEPEEEPELNRTRFDRISQDEEEDKSGLDKDEKSPEDETGTHQDHQESSEQKEDIQKPATERENLPEDTKLTRNVQEIPEKCDPNYKQDLRQEEQAQIHHLQEAVIETDHKQVDVHETPSRTDKDVKEDKEAPNEGDEDLSRSIPDPETEEPGKSESGHQTTRVDQLEEDKNSTTVSAPEVQPEEPPKESSGEPPEPRALDTREKEDLTSNPASSNSHPFLRLRRSSSSNDHPSILSEDTFKVPQHVTSDPDEPTPQQQSHQAETQTLLTHQRKTEKPRRRGLFHLLRSDAPPKPTVPKILIQDFSKAEEKLSSKERRRRRREQERKQKDEEKERKRRDKEQEKEREKERKKIQTRGRSFQVLARKHEDDAGGSSGGSSSQALVSKRNSAPFSESYF